MGNTDSTAGKMERALRIVRENIQPHEKIDDYAIFCDFAPCVCTEMHNLTGMLCTRCDEISGINDLLQRQLIANAMTCFCKM